MTTFPADPADTPPEDDPEGDPVEKELDAQKGPSEERMNEDGPGEDEGPGVVFQPRA